MFKFQKVNDKNQFYKILTKLFDNGIKTHVEREIPLLIHGLKMKNIRTNLCNFAFLIYNL